MEPAAGNATLENLWVGMKDERVDVIVGIYYRPHSQGEDTDELFLKELRNSSTL